jgi:hypothetical protein
MKRIALLYLNTAAAISSILSLVALLLLDRWHALLALVAVIGFLLALLAMLWWALHRYLAVRYPDGYLPLSTFVRYSTTDGRLVRYEAFKHIQCRKPLMSSFRHGFKWTGSRAPVVTSRLQEVQRRTAGAPDEYDFVELRFARPLLYGEAIVVHHAMELDDSDHASAPHVEFRVTAPVQLIAWRVELRHLPRRYSREARVTRRRIDARVPGRPEHVARVPFDDATRGYEFQVVCPDPGYFYSLEWDR